MSHAVVAGAEAAGDSSPAFFGTPAPGEPCLPAPVWQTPTFLSDDWDDNTPPVRPALVPVQGGMPLLYAGESHMLYGEGGSGKSWTAYYAAAVVARGGGLVLLIDRESNRRTVRDRLKALGVSKEEAGRIAYWKTHESLMAGRNGRRHLDSWLATHSVTLIVLDSVAKDMAAAGLSENDPGEYIRWQQAVVEPWTAARITSLLIDHTGHAGAQRAPGARVAARGASSKKDQVSGASYYFEVLEHWTRHNSGRAQLTTVKDREGHRKAWTRAAMMTVEVQDSGERVRIILDASEGSEQRPTHSPSLLRVMEEVSQLLVANDANPLTGNKVGQHFKNQEKSPVVADRALKALVGEGFASASEPGLRGAVHYRSVKPFSATKYSAVTQGPSCGPAVALQNLF